MLNNIFLTCKCGVLLTSQLTYYVVLHEVMIEVSRDAPITHWPIIDRPIIGAKQSADYRLIQKVPETGQKPAVHTV